MNLRHLLALPLLVLVVLHLSACDSTSADKRGAIVGPVTPGTGTSGGSGGGSGGGSAGGTVGGSAGGSGTTNTPPTTKSDVGYVRINSQSNPIDVLANDSDADGDPLKITAVGITQSVPPAPGAILAIAADGKTLRYTPPLGFVGQQVAFYTISDGRGGSAQGVAVLTTSPLQLPPAALPDTFTLLTSSSAVTLDVLGNDIDGAGGGLVVSAASSIGTVPTANAGSVSVVNGALRYQPRAGFIGVETLSYTLRDANGATATATVLITVLPVAAPPVALPDVATAVVGNPVVIPVLANDVDLAGGGLTVTAVTALTTVPVGTNGSFAIQSDGTLRYTPASSTFIGVQTAQYTVRDVNGGTATGLITVAVTPTLPSLPPVAVPDVATLAGGTTSANLEVLANDIDASGGGLTVRTVSVLAALPANAGVSAATNGSRVQLTVPTGYAGVITLSYEVRDVNGGTSSAPVVVTVTPVTLPPIAVPDAETLAQDSPATSIPVLANDVDPAGGGLTLVSVEVASSLPTATHTATVAGNQLRFTPAAGFAGVVVVRYTVRDANQATATGLTTLVVTPAALILGPVTVPDAGTLAQNAAATGFAVLANDVDPAAGGLTLTAATAVSSVPAATHTVAVDGNLVRVTPAAGFVGAIVVQYTVRDVNGKTATGLLNLVVSPIAIPLGPVAVPDASTIAQDSPAADFDVLVNDIDPAAGGLTLATATVLSSLPTATHTVGISGNRVRFTPASGFAGTVVIQYSATDRNGLSATSVLSLVVNPLATVLGPVALPDTGSLMQNAPATDFAVLANDVDSSATGLTLTAASVISSLPMATHTVTLAGNRVRFTPATGFAGSVLVGYTVTDGNGKSSNGVLSVLVSPLAAVAGPVALPDAVVIALDTVTAIDVRANDVDPAGAGLTITAASVQSSGPPAVHGVSIVGNQLRFVPASAFAGVVTLAYTVRDTNNATSTGLVAVTVVPALPVPLPAAVGDVGSLVVSLLGGSTGSYNVLANDIDPAAAGLTLQSVAFADPSLVTPGSLLSIVGNQVQLIVPLAGVVTGVLPIRYTAVDGLGRTITGLLNVTLSL